MPANPSTSDDQKETVYHSLHGRTIVRIDNNLVVKSGHLKPHEADTFRFIAAKTTIPVPKVHDVRWENGQAMSIVMDYIPGERLDKAWDTLNTEQKISIADQLRGYMEQLRCLKGEYIGAIDRGKAIIGQISSLEGGPFDSEREFNDFILGDIVPAAPDLLRHYARFALTDDHEIVFTHSDFAPRNILVKDGHVTAIVDWEYAGWYPKYWEYIQALRQLKPVPDWPEYLPRILPLKYEK